MKVIKKDGRIVDYIPSKIKTSLYNCSNDIDYILTESDLDNICNWVNHTLIKLRDEHGTTSAYEIRGTVIDALIVEDFTPILSAYIQKKI